MSRARSCARAALCDGDRGETAGDGGTRAAEQAAERTERTDDGRGVGARHGGNVPEGMGARSASRPDRPAAAPLHSRLMNKRNKRILIGLILVVLGALGAAAGLYYHDQTKEKTVRGSSSVEFVTTETPGEKGARPRGRGDAVADVRLRRRAHSRRGGFPSPAAVQGLWTVETG